MMTSKYVNTKTHLGAKPSPRLLGLFLVASLLITVSCLAKPPQVGDIEGYWVMPDGSALIEIFPSGASFSVRVVALRDTRFTAADKLAGRAAVGDIRLDIHNPKPALRERSIVGLTIASEITFDNGRWSGGKIYDPSSGRTYRCTMELERDGLLQVRGYIGLSLLGNSLYWQRADQFQQRVATMLNALPS